MLSLLIMSSLLSACRTDALEESRYPDADSTIDTLPDEPRKTVSVRFMNMWSADSSENIAVSVRTIIDRFQSEHPHIVIYEVSISDQAAYYTLLNTLAAANELPDVFVCRGSELSAFANAGLVAWLNPILNANPEWRDGFISSSFADLSHNGNVYGIPFSMLSTHVIYYNQLILSAVGWDEFPTTWKDFIAMLEAVKATGIIPIALGNRDQWVANSCILSALGDRFTGSDWFKGLIADEGPSFTDPEFVQALEALQFLGISGFFNNDKNSLDNHQQKNLFLNGLAAMFMEGSWVIGSIMDGPEEIWQNTGVAVLPPVEGGKGVTPATSGGSGSGFAVGINSFDEKIEAITAFLQAISGEEYARLLSELGEPTAFIVADYDKSNVPLLAVRYAALAETLTFTPIYDSFLNSGVNSVLNSSLQELLIGALTPEQVALRLQMEMDRTR